MKYLAGLLLMAFSMTAGAAKTIQIGAEVFHLAESKGGEPAALEEYLPKGQTLANWRKLVAVRRFPKIDSPKDYIGNMVAEYRRQFPEMKFEAGSGPGGLYYMDCIMYSRGAAPDSTEWNYFVARKSSAGIIVYQYVERAVSEQGAAAAMAELDVKGLRRRMLPILQKSIFVRDEGPAPAK